MFLSRIELDSRRPSARDLHLLATAGGAHKLVWGWFARGDTRSRDFLFRLEADAPRIWTLSLTPPSEIPASWRWATREFTPHLREGDRLRFLVTVNPTVRTKTGPEPGKRHDVIMHEKARLRAAGVRESEAEIAQRAGAAWIASRGARFGCEFDLPSLQTERYRVERFARAGDAQVSVAMLDVRGILIVREPKTFVQAIFHGIGPSKAFGCGLMLLRRA